jgi:S-methylmethionine-dependent homocysteine/selenocysteine methylase
LIKSQKYLEGRAIKLMDQSMKLVVIMGFSLDDEESLPDSRPLPLAAEIEI